MRAIRLIAVAFVVAAIAGLTITLIFSTHQDAAQRLRTSSSALANTLQQGGVVTPYPTEVDLLAERRDAAGALADDSPELKPASEIIPAITACLEDDDAIVRLYGANAVRRIAMSSEAYSSGLRAAVRNDQDLQDALFDTLSHGFTQGPDGDDMRRDAAAAILWLYYDTPGSNVEQAMTAQYWDEVADEVRLVIVQTLCEHGYTSQSTRDVFENANDAYDSRLATTAQECLDALP